MYDRMPNDLSEGYLQTSINEGFIAKYQNYLNPIWTTMKNESATSFELKIDSNCKNKSQFDDITQGALLHCDCRYLLPKYGYPHEEPITNLFLSNSSKTGKCTDDINNGRGKGNISPLYLCWNEKNGDQGIISLDKKA